MKKVVGWHLGSIILGIMAGVSVLSMHSVDIYAAMDELGQAGKLIFHAFSIIMPIGALALAAYRGKQQDDATAKISPPATPELPHSGGV